MRLAKILAVLLLLVSLGTAEEKPAPKTVRVVGTSEVKVVPDRAIIQLGVESQSSSARLAKQAEDAVARRILGSLRGNGVDEKDIQTTWLSLEPQTYYHKGVRTTYFVASQTLSVTLRDLEKLDGVLESLIKAGGNRIESITYETSDLRKYRDQARDLAVKAAREKAVALAQALGQGIGKAESIDEVPEARNEYQGWLSNYSYEGGIAAKARAPSTAPGQKSVTASVIVAFELN